ncbi:MAG: hypothetical protein KAJ42_17560, partial [Gemmatimonadetes bacterium]|nr:hypothetical protein [Gemmatimonadota bacterium]
GWAEMTEGTARGEWVQSARPEAPIVSWRPGLAEVGLPLLAAGYERPEFAAPASFPVLFSVTDGGTAQVIARYGGDPDRLTLDGFIPAEDRGKIAGRPFMIVQPVGAGRVIYFAEDLTFRGAWYGMNLLFMNALLLGPTL